MKITSVGFRCLVDVASFRFYCSVKSLRCLGAWRQEMMPEEISLDGQGRIRNKGEIGTGLVNTSFDGAFDRLAQPVHVILAHPRIQTYRDVQGARHQSQFGVFQYL